MHDLDAAPRLGGEEHLDVLGRLPPPGRWAILHGPLAVATLRLFAGTSRAAAAGEVPPLPEDFSRPLSPDTPCYAWHSGRAWILRRDRNGEGEGAYVSCYAYGVR